MALPACHQSVLDGMERTLRANEPCLASMFAIFARLAEDDGPPAAERLTRWNYWTLWARSRLRTVGYAFVLIPVVVAAVVAALLFGLNARGVSFCTAGYSLVSGLPRGGLGCAANVLQKGKGRRQCWESSSSGSTPQNC
jgi:hypothetical protein